MKKKIKITKEMTFAEIMELDEKAGKKLAERGLFCGGCPMAAFESLENGAKAHGVDINQLLKDLNEEGSSSENLDGSSVGQKDGSVND